MQIYKCFGSLQTLNITVHPYCFYFWKAHKNHCNQKQNFFYFGDSCFSVKFVNTEFLTHELLTFVRKQVYALDNKSVHLKNYIKVGMIKKILNLLV